MRLEDEETFPGTNRPGDAGRAAYGDDATWLMFAGFSLAAAVTGAIAATGAHGRRRVAFESP